MATASKSPFVSKPVLVTLVLSVLTYAIYFATQPKEPAASPYRHVAVTASNTTSDGTGITAEDLTAHFPRYKVGTRDPFQPRITDASVTQAEGSRGQWALTGIESIDGVTSALVENSTTGDSAFLKPGDHWHGLTVDSIAPDAVVFDNELGQQTRLAFPLTADTGTESRNGSPTLNPAPIGGPGGGLQVTPLPGLAAPGTASPAPNGGQGNVNP